MTEATYRVVWIEWVDSAQCDGWEPIDAILATLREAECKMCVTIGFVLHESETSITTTSSTASAPEQAIGALTIPKCAIVKMYEVDFGAGGQKAGK